MKFMRLKDGEERIMINECTSAAGSKLYCLLTTTDFGLSNMV
jgi:hypothetical protein